jgi:hypothetical protein
MKALDEVTSEELEYAVNTYIKKGKWMPTVSTLLSIVRRKRFKQGEELIPLIRDALEKTDDYQVGRQTYQEDVDRVLVEMGYRKGFINADRV